MRNSKTFVVFFFSLSLLLTLYCCEGERVESYQPAKTAASAVPAKKAVEPEPAPPARCERNPLDYENCMIQSTLNMLNNQCIPSWKWGEYEELSDASTRSRLFVLAEEKGSSPRYAENRIKDATDRMEASIYLEAKKWAGSVKTPSLLLPFSFYTYEEKWELVIREDCQFDDRRVNEGEDMKKASLQTSGDFVAAAVFWSKAALEGKIDSYLDENGEGLNFYLSKMEFMSPIEENYPKYNPTELLNILESERLLRDHSANLTLLAKATALPVVGNILKNELRKQWRATDQNFGKLLGKHLEDDEYIYNKLGSRVSWFFRRWLSQEGGEYGDELIVLYRYYMAHLAKMSGMEESIPWIKIARTELEKSKTLKWKKEYITLLGQ